MDTTIKDLIDQLDNSLYTGILEFLNSIPSYQSIRREHKKYAEKLINTGSVSPDELDELAYLYSRKWMCILKYYSYKGVEFYVEKHKCDNFDELISDTEINTIADYRKLISQIKAYTEGYKNELREYLTYFRFIDNKLPNLAHYIGYLFAASYLDFVQPKSKAEVELSVKYQRYFLKIMSSRSAQP